MIYETQEIYVGLFIGTDPENIIVASLLYCPKCEKERVFVLIDFKNEYICSKCGNELKTLNEN
jgi:DNA-directed RNA polymerase subunit RPC12/RpoP